MWALLGAFISSLLAYVSYALGIMKSPVINQTTFDTKKVLYRSCSGNTKTFDHDQTIYSRRAKSLWGKEAERWPTFRISYQNECNFCVFGFILPDNFEVDHDCLTELGFSVGQLDRIEDCIEVELPLRCKYSSIINKYTINNIFKKPSPSIGEIREPKRHRVQFIRPLSEGIGFWSPHHCISELR